MYTKRFFAFFFLIFLCLQCEKRYNYNFDYPPPYINARLNEVFPASIFNYRRKVITLDFPEGIMGYDALYGDGILMKVIQFQQEEDAIQYFQEIIIPQFKTMSSRKTGKIDGVWQAHGKESNGRRWVGWVNHVWVFELSGSDEKNFDVVVRACRFVSFKK